MKLAEPLHIGGVVIEEVDIRTLSDDDVRALNAFENILGDETDADDPPRPVELTRTSVDTIPGFERSRDFWARDPDGSLAATAQALVSLTEDNQHICRVSISVRADRRRRGIARALLRLVADVAFSEGRRLLMSSTTERVPAGDAFAERLGAERGIAGHVNRLMLADVDRELVRRWIEDGPIRAEGYSLITVDGPYPDDLVAEIVDLGHVMNTEPRDDLDMEDRIVTVDQIRELEKGWFAQGLQRWCLLARNDATGALVGWTEVGWYPHAPKTVWQWGTGVRPEHRGHALGKWLKATMLERIFSERPGAEDVRTGNADSNAPMLGINNALGFKPFTASTFWQARVEQVRAYLDGSSV